MPSTSRSLRGRSAVHRGAQQLVHPPPARASGRTARTDKRPPTTRSTPCWSRSAGPLAPFLPLITEHIYRALTGERSVHLTDWPDIAALPVDRDLVERMDLAREVCSGVLTLREAHRRRTRLPLRTLTRRPYARARRQILQGHHR